jgi:hypothetical protein
MSYGLLEKEVFPDVDMPQVDDVSIKYYMEEVQTRQLSQFISRTANLKLAQFRRVQVVFSYDTTYIEFEHPQGECPQVRLTLSILDQGPGLNPVPYVVRVLGQLVAMLCSVGHLSIREVGGDTFESTEWLPLLRLFSAVEVLEVCGELSGYIASQLQDTTEEMVPVLLPALRLLRLADDNQKKPVGPTDRFLSSRQAFGRPVTIVNTKG